MTAAHSTTAVPPTAPPAGSPAGDTPPSDWPFPSRPRSREEFETRFPALAGKPNLDDHDELVAAIGFKARNLLCARRKRWTRLQRQGIEYRVSVLCIDAGVSLDRARAIWAELLQGRVPRTGDAS